MRWDDDAARWIVATNRGDAHAGPLRRAWPTARCTGRSCPASPASRRSRATRSTPAAGTTTTPAATPTGASTGLARQARRHHRHRRDRGPVRPAPRRGGRAALRLPAHAVVDRRARQPPDRSRVGGERSSRAGSSGGWTTSTSSSSGGFEDGGPRQRRLDRHHRQAADHAAPGRPAIGDRRTALAQHDGAGRLREDGADPRPRRRRSSTTRRRPRR